jgi:hypothetical protein
MLNLIGVNYAQTGKRKIECFVKKKGTSRHPKWVLSISNEHSS